MDSFVGIGENGVGARAIPVVRERDQTMSGPSEKVFLNGKIAPFSEAVVSIYTLAFRFGATVFEGLRSY